MPAGVPYAVYNFGSPRVGNQDFSEYYDSFVGLGNTWRVVNKAGIFLHVKNQVLSHHMTILLPPHQVWRPLVIVRLLL